MSPRAHLTGQQAAQWGLANSLSLSILACLAGVQLLLLHRLPRAVQLLLLRRVAALQYWPATARAKQRPQLPRLLRLAEASKVGLRQELASHPAHVERTSCWRSGRTTAAGQQLHCQLQGGQPSLSSARVVRKQLLFL